MSQVLEEQHSGSTPSAAPVPATSDLDIDVPVTIIARKPTWRLFDTAELWRFRELLFFLTWRDIKVRYKQTVLGVLWAILQPFATMVVFTLFLGKVAGIATSDLPYPVFVFAGLLPWIFFSSAVNSAGSSIVGNQNLVTKVYFPRLIIPASAVGAALVDFFIAWGMLLVLMLYYGVYPGLSIIATPLILLLLMVAALGVGTLLAALTVAYRDFRYVVPFGIQLWMFATPTIYLQAEVLFPRWIPLLPLNPAYGLIYNFRQAMLGGPIDWYALSISGGVSIALFILGCLYFRRVERDFADII